MEDKRSPGMKEQRLRRQRVNRMKKMIMGLLGIGFLTAIAFCIGLTLQVLQMRSELEAITAGMISVQENGQTDDYKSVSADNEGLQSHGLGENEELKENQVPQTSGSESMAENPDEDIPLAEENVKKVYLTFDDGPSAENTPRILDILKEKNVKATFFVIGNEEDYAPELYRRIVEEGHTLGMHSYSHKYSVIYDTLDSFQSDFYQLKEYLTEITGITPSIMRFPGGSSNSVSNIDIQECIRFLQEEGVTYYDWNVISGDATSQVYTVDELIRNVVQDVAKNDTSIVLMHDAETKGTTVEALGPMIDQLKEMGCELLPIDSKTKVIQHITADNIDE